MPEQTAAHVAMSHDCVAMRSGFVGVMGGRHGRGRGAEAMGQRWGRAGPRAEISQKPCRVRHRRALPRNANRVAKGADRADRAEQTEQIWGRPIDAARPCRKRDSEILLRKLLCKSSSVARNAASRLETTEMPPSPICTSRAMPSSRRSGSRSGSGSGSAAAWLARIRGMASPARPGWFVVCDLVICDGGGEGGKNMGSCDDRSQRCVRACVTA